MLNCYSLRILPIILLLIGELQAQSVEIPNTFSGTLLKKFLQVVEQGEYDQFISDHFGGKLVTYFSKEEHRRFLSMLHRQHGGFTVYKIEKSEENRIITIVKSKKQNAWRRLIIETELSTPDKITGIEIDQTAAPEEYLETLPKITIKRPVNDHSIVNGAIAKKIDEYMKKMEAVGFSGGLIISQNNEIILARGYGYANREQEKIFNRNTVFTIGSITKQFTGAAIVKLESMGKISFDDPITKFFTNVPKDKRDITLHQLLTHSAGFPEAIGSDYEQITKNDFVKEAMNAELIFKPGERYSYSNVGYSLLAAVIENVSGQNYESFLREHLFIPAKMKLTGYVLPKWDDEQIVTGYKGDKRWGKPTERLWSADGPGWHLKGNGGILSTIDDMHQWGAAIMGDQVFSDIEKQNYLTPYIPEGPDEQSYYAYGWVRMKSRRGTEVITHNGGNPYIQNDMYIYPEEKVIMFITSNNGDFSAIDQSGKILSLIFRKE